MGFALLCSRRSHCFGTPAISCIFCVVLPYDRFDSQNHKQKEGLWKEK